jgi:hypothetical protein
VPARLELPVVADTGLVAWEQQTVYTNPDGSQYAIDDILLGSVTGNGPWAVTRGNQDSNWPTISENGRWLLFATQASNLAAADPSTDMDLVRYDSTAPRTQ